jgi:hypothetical protein
VDFSPAVSAAFAGVTLSCRATYHCARLVADGRGKDETSITTSLVSQHAIAGRYHYQAGRVLEVRLTVLGDHLPLSKHVAESRRVPQTLEPFRLPLSHPPSLRWTPGMHAGGHHSTRPQCPSASPSPEDLKVASATGDASKEKIPTAARSKEAMASRRGRRPGQARPEPASSREATSPFPAR